MTAPPQMRGGGDLGGGGNTAPARSHQVQTALNSRTYYGAMDLIMSTAQPDHGNRDLDGHGTPLAKHPHCRPDTWLMQKTHFPWSFRLDGSCAGAVVPARMGKLQIRFVSATAEPFARKCLAALV